MLALSLGSSTSGRTMARSACPSCSASALARTWDEVGQQACASCHGRDLRGVGKIPPLAGRSPTYIARQLNDLKTGAGRGPQTDPMKPVVASMHNEDMIALTAFIGSRKP